jgi:putative sigma-54 modulation protein
MKLQMHSIHFDADQKLLDYIQKKAEKLDTFYDRITGGEVFLRLNKDTTSNENKVVEIKLAVPGHTLFAKEHSSSFEAATDEALEALKAQIKKFKEKMLERA